MAIVYWYKGSFFQYTEVLEIVRQLEEYLRNEGWSNYEILISFVKMFTGIWSLSCDQIQWSPRFDPVSTKLILYGYNYMYVFMVCNIASITLKAQVMFLVTWIWPLDLLKSWHRNVFALQKVWTFKERYLQI